MQTYQFEIFGLAVKVNTAHAELIDRLKNDFGAFPLNSDLKPFMEIDIFYQFPIFDDIPKMPSTGQSENSIYYDVGNTRFNDYYGDALSIIDYNTEKVKLYALDVHLLHELSYLVILSRTARKMDLMGYHKLHASAVFLNGKAHVFMLPSKGGKSTLLKNILEQYPKAMIISDDSPVFDKFGNLYSFPLRIGLNDDQLEGHYIKLNRRKHGTKYLYLLMDRLFPYKNKIEASNVVLYTGNRGRVVKTQISEGKLTRIAKALLLNGIIGLGLPIIKEYFLRKTLLSIFENFFILCLRVYSFSFVCMMSKKRMIYIKEGLSSFQELKLED